jgi:type I restriction enzyme S subunit
MGGEPGAIRLGDVCTKIGSGATPRGGSEVYLERGPYALIRSQNVYNGGFHRDGLAFISEGHANELSNVEVQRGDVLLNITGDSVARVCQVPDDVLPARVNQHVAIIRPQADKLDARYLRCYLVSPSMQANMLALAASGATRNALTKAMIEDFAIPARPLREQRAIAHILGTLDDKIELNRRMNQTLEALARTAFGGMMGDSEGKTTQLDAHVDVAKGLSYKGSGLAHTGAPLHNLNSVYEGGGYKPEGIKFYNGEYKDCHVCRPGDIIVANTEQGFDYLLIGYPAIVPGRFGTFGLFTHHIYRVRPKPDSPLTNHFIYLLLMSRDVREQVISFTNGTTVNALAIEGLHRPQFVLPPAERIRQFEETVASLFAKQEANTEESRSLAALRDALLPKLISGELRVPPQMLRPARLPAPAKPVHAQS